MRYSIVFRHLATAACAATIMFSVGVTLITHAAVLPSVIEQQPVSEMQNSHPVWARSQWWHLQDHVANATDYPSISWPAGTVLTLKHQIPFAWMRQDANSMAGVVLTVGSNTRFIAHTASWDGTQWWQSVSTLGVSPSSGWIEQGSLQVAPIQRIATAQSAPPTPQLTTSCIATYSGQVSIAFLNYRTKQIWINGLDANCHEFHMWPMVGNNTAGYLLALPPGTRIVRIRDYASNQLLAQYTIIRSMNGNSIQVH